MSLEKMNEFFNKRANTYDNHMLVDLQLKEFYEAIAGCFPASNEHLSLLDLGCGTGIQLERLFDKMPNLSVTGIDLSQEMLNVLKDKYPGRILNLLCQSYFDTDFDIDRYNYALSTYSLHHFSESEKSVLYKRIFNSLKDEGIFIEGDYTCKTIEQQEFYLSENKRLRRENKITDGFYHYDTPFTADTQINLLKSAGFYDVRVVHEWENTSIFIAIKKG